MIRTLLACALAAALLSAAQMQTLRSRMREARQHGDWRTVRSLGQELRQFLNGSPDALLDMARADAHLNDLPASMEALRKYVQMGQANEVVNTLPDFAPVRAL